MRAMRRSLRTIAAVLTGLALVAALPAPCGCAPESASSRHADEHACCAPPTGVRAVDHGCCAEAPATATAVSAPVVPDAVAPSRTVLLAAATPVRQPPAPASRRDPGPLSPSHRPARLIPKPRGRGVPARVSGVLRSDPAEGPSRPPSAWVRSLVRCERDDSPDRLSRLRRRGARRVAGHGPGCGDARLGAVARSPGRRGPRPEPGPAGAEGGARGFASAARAGEGPARPDVLGPLRQRRPGPKPRRAGDDDPRLHGQPDPALAGQAKPPRDDRDARRGPSQRAPRAATPRGRGRSAPGLLEPGPGRGIAPGAA